MRESPADIAELQQGLDESMAAAGGHLGRTFDEAHRPTAAEIVATLDGIIEVDLACVTGDGAPLVAPIDAIPFKERNEAHGALMRDLYVAMYGPGWLEWYDNLDHSGDVIGWIESRRIFARRA